MGTRKLLWLVSLVGLLLMQLPALLGLPLQGSTVGLFAKTLGVLFNGPGLMSLAALFGQPFASSLGGNVLGWVLTLILLEPFVRWVEKPPPPTVELVHAQVGLVVFVCNRELKVGRDATIRVRPPLEAGPARSATVKVSIQQSRPLAQGHLAYVAALHEELPFQPALTPVDAATLRRGERLECRVRVLSPDLPGYSAISTDLSPGGIQLETRSAIDVGEIVRLRLESEFSPLEVIELQARVAWGRAEGNKRFRAGLEFQNLNIEARSQLDEFHRYLKRRQEANLTQRMLESADRYLLSNLARSNGSQ